jgi:hypothetical protein
MRLLIPTAVLGLALLPGPAAPQFYRNYFRNQARAYPDDPRDLVRSWYRTFLNREPDPGGLRAWVGALRAGNSPEQALASILSSQEYYAKGGNTPQGFIRNLYRDIAGRPPTGREMDYWLRRMRFDNRADIAYALITRFPQSWRAARRGAEDDYDYRRPRWRFR